MDSWKFINKVDNKIQEQNLISLFLNNGKIVMQVELQQMATA